jgi:DNA-binding NtrC family response regulator
MLVDPGTAFLGRSAAARHALDLALAFGPTMLPVLLLGPSGSGKGLLARILHDVCRPNGTWRCVTGGELLAGLWYSRLYGHERGSFTGADAAHAGEFALSADGTLFLDEIHHWPRDAQSGLLRALNDGVYTALGGKRPLPVTSRLVFATTREPDEMVRSGDLIPDLQFRLPALTVTLPSLVERLDDVLPLASTFRDRLTRQLGLEWIPRFAPDAVRALLGHSWPGNVRELLRKVERAMVLACHHKSALLSGELLGLASPGQDALDRTLPRDVLDAACEWALEEADGSRTAAAAMLGRHRHTIRRRITVRRARASECITADARDNEVFHVKQGAGP